MDLGKIASTLTIKYHDKPKGYSSLFISLALIFGALSGFLVVSINNSLFILMGLIGVLIFLLTLYSEEFGLYVLVFISYTRFSDVLIEFEGFISIAKPYVALLIVAIILRWVLFGKRPKGWERPTVLFAILSFTGLISLFYSPVPDRVWLRLLDDLKDILIAMIIIILLQQGPRFHRVLWTLIIAGFFLGTLSVYQYFSGKFDNNFGGFAISEQHQIIGTIDDYRASGPIGDPNFFAQIMIVIVPISLERFLHEKRKIFKLISLWTFAVSVLTIFFTYSRGGLLALIFGMMILLFAYPPKGSMIPILIFSSILFVAFLPSNYVERLSTLTDIFKPRPSTRIDERSLQGRLSENLAALEMIKENPLFGVGLGSFNNLFPQYSKKLGLALVASEREAHNLYLEVAAETGIVGFSLFAIVLYSCIQTVIQSRKKFIDEKMEDYVGMTTGFLAGWLGYLAAALFIQNAFPRYFFLLLGIALSLQMVTKNTILPDPVKE